MMMVTYTSKVNFKRYKGSSTYRLNGCEIPSIGIGFIGRNLIDIECLGCLVNQWNELEIIRRFA